MIFYLYKNAAVNEHFYICIQKFYGMDSSKCNWWIKRYMQVLIFDSYAKLPSKSLYLFILSPTGKLCFEDHKEN